jgi:hypothetical protein
MQKGEKKNTLKYFRKSLEIKELWDVIPDAILNQSEPIHV